MNGRTLLPVGLGALLVASMVAGAAGSAVAAGSTDRTAVEGGQYLQETEQANQTGGLNLSDLSVTAYEAARLAQNETGGTVLGVRLKQVDGTPGYEVLVANESGKVTGVVVNATEAGILETRENLAQVNQTVLEQQGVSVSDISGASTIETAQQEVGEQFVPIEVSIEAEQNFMGQQVTFVSPNGTQSVVVDLSNGSVVQVSDVAPKRGAQMGTTMAESENTTTEAALTDADGTNAAQEGDDTLVGDDELSHEFGDASEYVSPTLTGYADNVFASDDEFDTADAYGPFVGNEGNEDEGLFDGEGGEEGESEGFVGEEDEDGWF
ncbi:hypothetical protein M0R89_00220 [Halorussus limi]|uniref:PepSY domain-containing protein n=1 Tax=Halorussus limi TaxID=2938695 RepID=A0A8U0HUT4_9EURY|nr:hypothetical protein [Halorussus limi]UPV74511.1 hypothetical protein M0R89_00220 [Halorussus limi]